MKPAREIELEAMVVGLERQLVAMDAALMGEGLALARRYELALREIMRFPESGNPNYRAAEIRTMKRVAQMALQAEKSVTPAKRCQAPECVLARGHGGFHNDGLREWGKRPHHQHRPLPTSALSAQPPSHPMPGPARSAPRR